MRTLNLILKTAFWTLFVLFAFTLLIFILNVVWRGIISATPLPDSAENFPIVAVLIVALLFIPNSWWRRKKEITVKATGIINAPLDKVWDAVYPRQRSDHFVAGVEGINSDPDNPRAFHFIYTSLFEISGSKEPFLSEVLVTDVREPSYVSYEYDIPQKLKSIIKGRARSEFTLEKAENGTNVTISENMQGVSNLGYLMFKYKNPADDAMAQLASYCEGVPDTSFTGKAYARMKSGKKPQLFSIKDGYIVLITISSVLFLILWGVFEIFPWKNTDI